MSQFPVKKEIIYQACYIALEYVKKYRRKEWKKAIHYEMHGRWKIFQSKTVADAAKYLKQHYDYPRWEYGYSGMKREAKELIAACEVTCSDELVLDKETASLINNWLS